MWSLSVSAQTDPNAVRTVRKMVRRIVADEGGTTDEAQDLELAVGEALFNAVVHAYPEAIGPVSLTAVFDGGTFTFAVHDHGAAGSTPTVPRTLPPTGKGRGLFLIASLVDHVAVSQSTTEWRRGVSVTMMRRLLGGGTHTRRPVMSS